MATNSSKDYYRALGLARNAGADDIRKAYRRLARKYHPDVNPGDPAAEVRFKDIQEAYTVLSDEKKRRFYDRHGFYSDQAFSGSGGAPPGGGRPGGFGFDGFDFSDLGRQGGAGSAPDFGSLFDTILGGGRRSRTADGGRQPGEDLEYAIDIPFRDAILGSTERLNISRQGPCASCRGSGSADAGPPRSCPQCAGTGQVQQAAGNMRFSLPCSACRGTGEVRNQCPSCGGEGRVSDNASIEVRIPPGTQENARLRVAGKGNAGLRGGSAGDLYIEVRVGRHPFFERKGDDIHIEVPITPAEAVLGAKIEVPTIDGTAFLRIPPASSSGKTFRVRSRGVRNPRSGTRGHQFVRISVVVPEIPDESTKELMRRYAELNPGNPREAILRPL